MGKLQKVLHVINLLTHRQQVTLETIKDACRIPERTAYRYLRDISEANFPVYYDKDARAYCLSRRSAVAINDLGVDEAILVILGLRRLSTSVVPQYKMVIDTLITKLLVRQNIPLEEITEPFDHQIDSMSGLQDNSDLVSSILISAAIRCGRKTRVVCNRGGVGEQEVEIENPALHFRNEWFLADAKNPETKQISVSSIVKVSIV